MLTSNPSQTVTESYPLWLRAINQHFNFHTKAKLPLAVVRVDRNELFDVYIANLPEHLRQEHNCHTCKEFLRHYGAMVAIHENGEIESVFWGTGDEPPEYRNSSNAMKGLVESRAISHLHYDDKLEWGRARTGDWTHFAVTGPEYVRVDKPHQRIAQRKEHFGIISRALARFDDELTERAKQLLESEVLRRNAKVLGPITWFLELQIALTDLAGHKRQAEIWRRIATAPDGFCHINASMGGMLLDDLAGGMDIDTVVSRFNRAMDPLAYQRPQARPKAQNILAAEKKVAELGLAPSLERRMATLADMHGAGIVWAPRDSSPAKKTGGVFDHLKEDQRTPTDKAPAQSTDITWVKFLAKVLPTARSIEVRTSRGENMALYGLTTAVHDDAPPLLAWDCEPTEDKIRNPVAWYTWSGGVTPASFGLTERWTKVDMVVNLPCHWYGKRPNENDGVFMLLEGAKDTRNVGLALFPECMRSELREVRSVIEAHSHSGKLVVPDGPVAAGVGIREGRDIRPVTVNVTTPAGSIVYRIDRWD